MLEKLMAKFESATSGPKPTLSKEQFIEAFAEQGLVGEALTGKQLGLLFDQIDINHDGTMEWDEFATFLMLELQENAKSVLRENMIRVEVTGVSTPVITHETVIRARHFRQRQVATCCCDGTFSVVMPSSSNSGVIRRGKLSPHHGGHGASTVPKCKWITDFAISLSLKKVIVASNERELWLYDISTFEQYCVFVGLDSKPLRVDTWYDSDTHDSFIAFGDDQGVITVIGFPSTYQDGMFFKRSTSDKFLPVPSIPLDSIRETNPFYGNLQYSRWEVHHNWVNDVQWLSGLNMLASCADDSDASLVLGEAMRVFADVPKTIEISGTQAQYNKKMGKSFANRHQNIFSCNRGVKTFCHASQHSLLVTGGIDRIIRLWNPYIPGKPVALLRGHTAQVSHLNIVTDGRLASLSSDSLLKIWDLVNQFCLFTLSPKIHHLGEDIEGMLYSSAFNSLVCINAKLHVLNLYTETKASGAGVEEQIFQSHTHPIRCAVHNTRFFQLITGSEDGVIRVWDMSSGEKLFEFKAWEKGSAVLSSMTLDEGCSRLATCGTDGIVNVWNYNNGQHLAVYYPADHKEEITTMLYIHRRKLRTIYTGGWCRHVHAYKDELDTSVTISPYPQNHTWDQSNGHKDDITCMSFMDPCWLASGSFDGQIIIWNTNSGQLVSRFKAPEIDDLSLSGGSTIPKEAVALLKAARSVSVLCFIPSRSGVRNCASLIAAGPNGRVCFWNTIGFGMIMADLKLKSSVRCISLFNGCKSAIVGDTEGRVTIWNLEQYAIKLNETSPPPVLLSWEAHLTEITSALAIEGSGQMLYVTTSVDCCARLWGPRGEFFGTFGQKGRWDILSPIVKAPSEIEKLRARKLEEAQRRPTHRQSRRLSGVYGIMDQFAKTGDSLLDELEKITNEVEAGVQAITDADTQFLPSVYSSKAVEKPHLAQDRRFGFGDNSPLRAHSAPATGRLGNWQRQLLQRPTTASHKREAVENTVCAENIFSKVEMFDLRPVEKPCVAKPVGERKYYEDIDASANQSIQSVKARPPTASRASPALRGASRPTTASGRSPTGIRRVTAASRASVASTKAGRPSKDAWMQFD